jgi:hypothetical protein
MGRITVPKLCLRYAFQTYLPHLAFKKLNNLHNLKGDRKNESLSLRHAPISGRCKITDRTPRTPFRGGIVDPALDFPKTTRLNTLVKIGALILKSLASERARRP